MAVSKKKVGKKKVAGKKKVVSKKKIVAKKKVAVTKKKAVSKKKVVAAKKTISKRNVITKKKVVAVKKATNKKKVVADKKVVAVKKSKSTPKKKIVTKKKVSRKKTAPTRKAEFPTSFDDFKPYKETKGEEYMNGDQSEHFKHLLLAWLKDLQEEVDRTVDHMQSDASSFSDPNDRATQEEEFALELRTRDRERKLTKKIRVSLADIESGDYGFCEVCGIEIGIRRLEARPTATLCIDCKTLDEIKEKQMG